MKIRGDEPFRSYENCRRPGVAILDMQMSKVPIISGYDKKSSKTPRVQSESATQRRTQHNGQKKKHKRKNNDLQNMHIKLKIE
jgi:hypothetical protein